MLKLKDISHSKQIFFFKCQIQDNRLFFRNRLYILNNKLCLLLVQTSHNSAKNSHLRKNAYTSVSLATSSGLSLVLILEPLYVTVIDVNTTRALNNSTKELLNLFLCLFNGKETYQSISSAFSLICSNSPNLTLL
jgi:hypothetical protein